jgi:transcriptional regulator GlxA family with amidase domain
MVQVKPRIIGFLLIPGFGLLSYASAIEPLRAANELSGRTLYRWCHLSPDGTPVYASNGISISPDERLQHAIGELDALFVLAGGKRIFFNDAATFGQLRRFGRLGRPIGGIGGGPYVLARAGLLDGYRFTLHREYVQALMEELPDLDIKRSLFEVDRNRLTCSGGTTSLDMMHYFILQQHGSQLAVSISDWLMLTNTRDVGQSIRLPLSERLGVKNEAVLRAVTFMETHVGAPLTRERVAGASGISARQLERLFREHLRCTPGRYYLQLRLTRARLLLRQSALSITKVSHACGFSSSSQFARVYRQSLGVLPSVDRRG